MAKKLFETIEEIYSELLEMVFELLEFGEKRSRCFIGSFVCLSICYLGSQGNDSSSNFEYF